MTPRELLSAGARMLGVPLASEQIDSLFLYLNELHKWNRKINLTAITNEREVIIKHVLDSLAYIKGFDPMPGTRLLDMGSGAGFPALPIKIAFPGLLITMVDSIKKKASFLRHVVRMLQLPGVEVLDKRIEEIPVQCKGTYDVVTARAFSEMTAALTAGMPLLKPGGVMVLSRGPDEVPGEVTGEALHVEQHKVFKLTLPHSDYRRAIWVFRKPG